MTPRRRLVRPACGTSRAQTQASGGGGGGAGSGTCVPAARRSEAGRDLDRIRSLTIPPAWTDVWICRSPNGHLQATGRDARGRKQYRYHPRWQEVRDETKYHRMIAFGAALPGIRRQVRRDMGRHSLTRERVLATVVQLLDGTSIRVGNDDYARTNGSYGLTTLRDRHVDVHGSRVDLHFRGKGGKQHELSYDDPRVARIITRCQALPGRHLFQFVNADGDPEPIDSEDVNAYLQEIAGDDFTAKDFRTWTGTVLAAWALDELGRPRSKTQARKQQAEAVKAVAAELGNTPAVCRRCYIHPDVMEAQIDGTLFDVLDHPPRRRAGLAPEETAVLRLLRESEAA